MKDVTIREIRPSDMLQIEKLIATRPELDLEGARKRAKLMEWIAFNNPYAQGEVTYWVAEQKGKVIAFHGRMPSEFNFKGEAKRGYFLHDMYVDPKSRKKGLGFWITMAFANEIEENSPNFFILIWMTGFNLLMQRRRGYLELESKISTYKKVLKTKKYLTDLLKSDFLASLSAPIADAAIRVWDWIKVDVALPDAKLTKVTHFDSRYDDFIQRISPTIGISSVKRSKILNWRYIDRPFPRDTVLALEEGGRIKGFVVLCNNPRDQGQGEIIDLVADPEDGHTITSLIKGAIKHFRGQGKHTIGCFMSSHKFTKYLTKCVFLTRKEKKAVLLGNCDNGDLQMMKDLQNWHITKAESDGFMLNFN